MHDQFPVTEREAAAADLLSFAPVPSAGNRRDGWTPERQRRFILMLATTGVVARAAKAVGMGATSAYRLRARPGGEEFARAWDGALQQGRDRAWEAAFDRAVNGVPTPRYYRGRLVGTVRRFDYRLALAALHPPAPPRRPAQEPPRE